MRHVCMVQPVGTGWVYPGWCTRVVYTGMGPRSHASTIFHIPRPQQGNGRHSSQNLVGLTGMTLVMRSIRPCDVIRDT